MSNSDSKDDLDNEWKDNIVSLAKGAAGLAPMIGGPLAEIIGSVIPGQRSDRIVRYLRGLAKRVDHLEIRLKESGEAARAEKIDLIEEGGYQAARATSQKRIDLIIEAVAKGLNEKYADIVRRKRLLSTLGELDEDEVILLNAYGQRYGNSVGDPFADIDRPRTPHLSSSDVEIERHQLFESGKTHLLRLGLLKKNYGNMKKGQLPDFDTREGDFKHNIEVSHFGRMLLKEIGMPSPFDQ